MRRILVSAVVATLAACSTTGPLETGRDATLLPGAQAALPDASTLTYVGIANDSRCPPQVQCIRAGDADVLFDHATRDSHARIVLNTERARSATLGAWQLQLVALAHGAAPQAIVRITSLPGTASP